MKIELNEVGKRYRDNWIFKNVSLQFQKGKSYALLGANGSGKSTLLRIIAGIQSPNAGTLNYNFNQKDIEIEKVFKQISYCAPGMDIIDEMTLVEFLNFHFSFKQLLPKTNIALILELLEMKSLQDKFIHEFSSGMTQRVKLAQAFFADTPILLLDEPCSNLDTQGVDLYKSWIKAYSKNRIVIIASNDEREYEFADEIIAIEHFKESV